ncbi:MAG: bifunctional diaminohydroxyphosphoribosylaminopyrimidine deaminase/5-amino-6-(5-phosphoribosylamino)uracil reductase RibD [Planctomycetes bacterium]|nr:bifunctional diaminohydroxyphosphoribosylaminopyrimidine deaminase/5-amino-6-(5-phosphoribosylamino)uracil reductase RibD [Planctomycetota bacterium]
MIIDPAPEDRHFMAEALHLAARIPRRPWPNPPVGALVVRDGRIVGRGAHHGPGLAHAEVLALEEAGALARDATLYCTLEPCTHTGRTPPCAPRVAASGVRRLVVAVGDPNPAVTGRGLDVLDSDSIDLTIGVLAESALGLIWPFAVTRAFERPFVVLKTATSLDGRFAPAGRPSGAQAAPLYLTGEEARRDVHRLRRWADVVLIGEGTLAADRPQLNGRLAGPEDDCPAADPAPGYVDTDLSYTGPWPADGGYVFFGRGRAGATARARAERSGMSLVACDERDGHVAPESLVQAAADGIGSVILIEGGPTIASAYLKAGLVDRWVRYTAPLVLGEGPAWPAWTHPQDAGAAQRFCLTRVERLGPDVKTVFDRLAFDKVVRDLTVHRIERLRNRAGRA